MERFRIAVGNTSDIFDHAECAQYSGSVLLGERIDLQCYDTGRYISFQRYGGKEIDRVTICEFVVMGYQVHDCPKGRFGEFCEFNSSIQHEPRCTHGECTTIGKNISLFLFNLHKC